MKFPWIDVHAHLDKLEEDPELALQNAFAHGVETVFTIGTDPKDLPVVLQLAEKNFPKVFCTLGIHPHDGMTFTSEVGRFIKENLHHPWVAAVGEIGLDYYYDQSPRDLQKEAFLAQMEIAAEAGMPVEIHTRDAEEDTVEILKKYHNKVRGIIHCFTGTQWLADQALSLGYDISISGVVTFKNAQNLRDIVKTIPMDRIHVETDAPFLAPVPHRGKKNTPAFVVDTAKVVAEIKGVSMQELSEQTRQNAYKMFPKVKP